MWDGWPGAEPAEAEEGQGDRPEALWRGCVHNLSGEELQEAVWRGTCLGGIGGERQRPGGLDPTAVCCQNTGDRVTRGPKRTGKAWRRESQGRDADRGTRAEATKTRGLCFTRQERGQQHPPWPSRKLLSFGRIFTSFGSCLE